MAENSEPLNLEPANVERRNEVTLPHGAQVSGDHRGWTVKLAIKGEAIRVQKQVVVGEEVITRLVKVDEQTAVNESVLREELRVDVEGHGRVNSKATHDRNERAV